MSSEQQYLASCLSIENLKINLNDNDFEWHWCPIVNVYGCTVVNVYVKLFNTCVYCNTLTTSWNCFKPLCVFCNYRKSYYITDTPIILCLKGKLVC